MTTFDLDLGQLPQILNHRLFYGIPNWIDEPLAALGLPEAYDRLRGAVLMLDKIGAEDPVWQQRAYLRAGLSEFRSVPQALHWDLGRRDVHRPEDSRNPLVHLVWRLRRITVYVANAPTEQREVSATLTLGGNSMEHDIPILLIRDLGAYLRREKFKDYRPGDLAALCDWFEVNQAGYGAPLLLSVGVLQYCQELCEVYG